MPVYLMIGEDRIRSDGLPYGYEVLGTYSVSGTCNKVFPDIQKEKALKIDIDQLCLLDAAKVWDRRTIELAYEALDMRKNLYVFENTH